MVGSGWGVGGEVGKGRAGGEGDWDGVGQGYGDRVGTGGYGAWEGRAGVWARGGWNS